MENITLTDEEKRRLAIVEFNSENITLTDEEKKRLKEKFPDEREEGVFEVALDLKKMIHCLYDIFNGNGKKDI